MELPDPRRKRVREAEAALLERTIAAKRLYQKYADETNADERERLDRELRENNERLAAARVELAAARADLGWK